MTAEQRRLVTGHDENGTAVFVADGPTPNVWEAPDGGPVYELWKAADRAENAADFVDSILGETQFPPPAGGSVFRIVDFAPREPGEQIHMHRTPSLDYCYIIDGTIVAVLDDEERVLSAGDVLVQRGTNHGWRNESGKPCKVLFVLIDTDPIA
ncbi:cupin domain-containing protein [Humibacter ginsenosidimutans]|uniref:Cupin domain-containing protein n=1 Tax=Humibacter ginsenosidimutans TaxID=2599293 RepID=A0A5B8LZW4_9MICO|nr:cupin domain-containing protein [Humibacter ginsenosidimutans]QDZ13596.1 cupin domain-containing protein [Humibacter ginsenosidimutans]